MPGVIPGLLWVKDLNGQIVEVINQARTAAYLQNGSLAIEGLMPCDVADYGGCPTYTMQPRCTDEGGWIDTPAVTSNGVTVADHADLDVTGDLTLIVRVRLDDVTPASTTYLFGRDVTYRMAIDSAGILQLRWTDNAAATHLEVASEGILDLLAGGAAPYLSATLDVDNGSTQHVVRFWYSWDGEFWTQIGTDNVNAGVTTIQNSSNPLRIGAGEATDQTAGEWLYAAVNDSIGVGGLPGIPSLNFEYDGEADLEGVLPGATSFVSNSGHTVNIAHSGGTPTVVVPFVSGADWDTLSFATPTADPAPWYSSEYPESADALGFYVEEWTGLDDRHVSRAATRYMTPRGGATIGAVGNRERVMKLNIFLFARSEEAMDYLFYWLASVLESVCGTCDNDKVLTRRYCGSTENPWAGMVEMRNVGLIEGLGWEADVTETGRCFIRRASFSLVAGDPCMYLSDSTPTVTPTVLSDNLGERLLDTNYSLTRIPCRPSCSELRATAVGDAAAYWSFDIGDAIGVKAPVITFTNSSDEYSFPFRAIIYADPYEIGVDPNPCGLLKTCEIYVRPLPPDSRLQWDIAGRELYYHDISSGGLQPSYAFIDANDPPIPRFAAFGCGTYHLALEPATLCIERVGVVGHVFEWQGLTFNEPAYPDVEIVIQERISCS